MDQSKRKIFYRTILVLNGIMFLYSSYIIANHFHDSNNKELREANLPSINILESKTMVISCKEFNKNGVLLTNGQKRSWDQILKLITQKEKNENIQDFNLVWVASSGVFFEERLTDLDFYLEKNNILGKVKRHAHY